VGKAGQQRRFDDAKAQPVGCGRTEDAMYEITEQFTFVATHQIQGLPDSHPCSGVHPHRWLAEVSLVADKLPPTDGPSELALLEPVRQYIAVEFDGRHLNDLLIGEATPARVARHLSAWCQEHMVAHLAKSLSSVTVSVAESSRGRFVFGRPSGGSAR
jgi:6-pyruvoyl-tetrahydropterin synthase